MAAGLRGGESIQCDAKEYESRTISSLLPRHFDIFFSHTYPTHTTEQGVRREIPLRHPFGFGC